MKTMTRSAEKLTREETINLRVLVDYIKCCHGRIGLQTMTDVVRESYMEKIWMKALTKNIQKKALVQKRNAIYTVMQNKFGGN